MDREKATSGIWTKSLGAEEAAPSNVATMMPAILQAGGTRFVVSQTN